MNAAQNFKANETYNPLYAKMQERFCSNGTIAEQMAREAGLIKKRSKKNALSRKAAFNANRSETKRSAIFNLKNMGIASMCVLFLSVLFFSGASINGIQQSFSAKEANGAMQASVWLEEQEAAPISAAYSLQDVAVTNL